MKHMILIFSLMLALSLALCGAAGAEERETFTEGDFTCTVLADGTAEITKYSGSAEELVIPAELGGRKVTAIGDSAFSSCWKLTSVTIPASVTTIGDSAFFWCYSLISVTIPDSVTTIGANPFAYCQKLAEVIVSKDHPALATIDGVLFSKADRRLVWYPMTKTDASYPIPQGIQIIGDYAFSCCERLAYITIPESVTSIGDFAFISCTELAYITIPASVTSIGTSAFADCPSLTLTVPAGSYAEQYCIDNKLKYTQPIDWLN